MLEIQRIAEMLDIEPEHLKSYGKWKAKISLESVHMPAKKKRGKLILVTGMTPTPAGEGKTVTAIGLSMGLSKLGHKAVVCLRQPSLGPVFGVKGGAAGGGKSTVEPMQDINLRFTGDIDAIGAAHNLLSAMIDNHIFHDNSLGIDIHTISWRRAMDMNERSLRHTVIGLGGKNDGTPREDGFVITAASEVMAILCMARDYADLKQRLGRIIVGYTKGNSRPVKALDLKASGAMASILKDAMEPNLVQTVEGTPALIHGGPFGNIAMGTCSLTSIIFTLNHSDFAIVEAGFATDLGAEKFFDVVSRVGCFGVDCAIIVVTLRALEYHGGSIEAPRSGLSLNFQGIKEEKLLRGLENLEKHIENVRTFGVEPIIAINKFSTDTDQEIQVVEDFCRCKGVSFAVSAGFEEGGAGCVELAEMAVEACEKPFVNKPIYSFEEGIQSKIEKIVTLMYGGEKTEYEPEALRDMDRIESLGLSNLPLCMAKTQLSLSDDPKRLGRPRNFTSIVRRLDLSAGAGFIVADMGDIIPMPGLPIHPAAENIDLNENGIITGVY